MRKAGSIEATPLKIVVAFSVDNVERQLRIQDIEIADVNRFWPLREELHQEFIEGLRR